MNVRRRNKERIKEGMEERRRREKERISKQGNKHIIHFFSYVIAFINCICYTVLNGRIIVSYELAGI